MGRFSQIGFALGAASLILLGATGASAQDVSTLQTEVNGFDGRIGELERTYLKPAMLAVQYKTEARYNDAKVAYFSEDYQRASVLFMDIVQKEAPQSFPSYREASFLLGDSLYNLRNYNGARRHFLRVINMGPGAFHEESAEAFLQIAFETRNFDGVDDVMSKIRSGMNSALQYITGKTLYRQGRFGDARNAFRSAAVDAEYAVVAEYFRGVSFAAEGKHDEAQRVFFDLTKSAKPSTTRDVEVLELAWIAQGRLAYEKGDLNGAVDMYGRIPRASDHFDRALWEMTWAFVGQEKFREARRNVEILLLSEPDPAFVPEAKLLKADLSVRLAEFEVAEADFRDVVDTYSPVKKEMDEFAAQQTNLQEFFGSLVSEELSGAEPSVAYPPLVKQWLEADPAIRTASRVIRDVQNVSTELDDAVRVLQEINARLDSSTRVQSFPQLEEGMTAGVEAEARLVEIRRILLNKHYRLVEGSMSPDQKSQYGAVVADLDQHEKKMKAMPTTRADFAERERQLFGEFDRLKRQLHSVSYEIDSQRAQLVAVDTYIAEKYGEPLKAAEQAKVDKLRSEMKQTIRELETLQKDIAKELAITRGAVGTGDPVMIAEAQLRQRYVLKMREAQAILDGAGGGSQVNAVRSVQERIPGLEKRLAAYFARMSTLVDAKVGEIQGEVRAEEKLLAEHRESLMLLVNASQGGAGVLAYLNFMRARKEFNELILRGEVGLIDVMWQQKEETSGQINQLFEDRTSELRMLQNDFEEVR